MILVFTDLDGTLLDHETYAYTSAEPALKRLKALSIPVILASSKTEAEMRPLADRLELDTPMIVENGAGIIGLAGDTQGCPCYAEIRAFLGQLPDHMRNHFQGFGDWSVDEVSRQTGLDRDAAALAQKRCFSEPGVWNGTDADFALFATLLDEQGFQAVRGGRFTTLMPKTSKGKAMARISAFYAAQTAQDIITIALGDGPNDVAMLEAADHGVVIANPANSPLPLLSGEREGKIHRSSKVGPEGWNEMIMKLVDELRPETAG